MSYLDLDFKAKSTNKKWHRHRSPDSKVTSITSKAASKTFLILAAFIIISFIGLSLFSHSEAKTENSNLNPLRLHYPLSLPLKEQHLEVDSSHPIKLIKTQETPTSEWVQIIIKGGDTLASIFSSAGLKSGTTHEVVTLNKQTKKLTLIRPGEKILIKKDNNNTLTNLKYLPSVTQTLVIKRQNDGSLRSELQHHPLDPMPVFKSGSIKTSLFEAAETNDISVNIIMELAGIFGWDIDFSLDIRKGDQFAVVYNELYKDGEKIRDGKILAASFTNKGKVYQALYYKDPKGVSDYFSPDGKSMRKAFLRSPVEFSRISSGFTRKRWHPVLSKWRSHKGVDYAAPRGTPVRASGDGKVHLKGSKGGYGKTIILKHGGKYTTVYAHLSRYAHGLRRGKTIKQGQIIGYVGSSGLATGPHLHYEFRLHGTHRNPLTIKLPAAKPINKAFATHFKTKTKSALSMLKIMEGNLLAQASK